LPVLPVFFYAAGRYGPVPRVSSAANGAPPHLAGAFSRGCGGRIPQWCGDDDAGGSHWTFYGGRRAGWAANPAWIATVLQWRALAVRGAVPPLIRAMTSICWLGRIRDLGPVSRADLARAVRLPIRRVPAGGWPRIWRQGRPGLVGTGSVTFGSPGGLSWLYISARKRGYCWASILPQIRARRPRPTWPAASCPGSAIPSRASTSAVRCVSSSGWPPSCAPHSGSRVRRPQNRLGIRASRSTAGTRCPDCGCPAGTGPRSWRAA